MQVNYLTVPSIEVYTFQGEELTSIGFNHASFEEKQSVNNELLAALNNTTVTTESYIKIKTLLTKYISFIHLITENNVFVVLNKQLPKVMFAYPNYKTILNIFMVFLNKEVDNEQLIRDNFIDYLMFKTEKSKKELTLTKTDEEWKEFIDFSSDEEAKKENDLLYLEIQETFCYSVEENEQEFYEELSDLDLIYGKVKLTKNYAIYEIATKLDYKWSTYYYPSDDYFPLFNGGEFYIRIHSLLTNFMNSTLLNGVNSFIGVSQLSGMNGFPEYTITKLWEVYKKEYDYLSFLEYISYILTIKA